MFHRFYVTGWSTRIGCWVPEVIEAKNKTAAKERFKLSCPTLKKVKAYPLRDIT